MPEAEKTATARGSSGSSEEVGEVGEPRPSGLLRATCAYGERGGSGEWPPPAPNGIGAVGVADMGPGPESAKPDAVTGKGPGAGAKTASDEPDERSAARMSAGAGAAPDMEPKLRRPAPCDCDELLAPGNDGARINSVSCASCACCSASECSVSVVACRMRFASGSCDARAKSIAEREMGIEKGSCGSAAASLAGFISAASPASRFRSSRRSESVSRATAGCSGTGSPTLVSGMSEPTLVLRLVFGMACGPCPGPEPEREPEKEPEPTCDCELEPVQVVDGVDGSGVASGFEKLLASAPANVRVGGRCFDGIGIDSGKRWPPRLAPALCAGDDAGESVCSIAMPPGSCSMKERLRPPGNCTAGFSSRASEASSTCNA